MLRTWARSCANGLPFSQVELAFCTPPPPGAIEPGMPMPTVPEPPADCCRVPDHLNNGAQRGGVVVLRRGDAMLRQAGAGSVQDDAGDLGAAKVDAQAQAGHLSGHRHRPTEPELGRWFQAQHGCWPRT